MTLGDYIRSMDDEKLAEFLVRISEKAYEENNLTIKALGLSPIKFDYEMEKKAMVEGLKKEIE